MLPIFIQRYIAIMVTPSQSVIVFTNEENLGNSMMCRSCFAFRASCSYLSASTAPLARPPMNASSSSGSMEAMSSACNCASCTSPITIASADSESFCWSV